MFIRFQVGGVVTTLILCCFRRPPLWVRRLRRYISIAQLLMLLIIYGLREAEARIDRSSFRVYVIGECLKFSNFSNFEKMAVCFWRHVITK